MKFLLPLFLSGSLFGQNVTNLYVGQQLSVGMQLTTAPASSTPVCSLYATVDLTYDVGYAAIEVPSIQIYNSGLSVCQVDIGFGGLNGSTSAHVEAWTAPNKGGTLLATSDSQPPSSYWWSSYHFATPVTYSGNVYYTLIDESGGGGLIWMAKNGGAGIPFGASYTGASTISQPERCDRK
jgi:hypothetical protein